MPPRRSASAKNKTMNTQNGKARNSEKNRRIKKKQKTKKDASRRKPTAGSQASTSRGAAVSPSNQGTHATTSGQLPSPKKVVNMTMAMTTGEGDEVMAKLKELKDKAKKFKEETVVMKELTQELVSSVERIEENLEKFVIKPAHKPKPDLHVKGIEELIPVYSSDGRLLRYIEQA